MNDRDINLTPAELKAVEDHKYFLSHRRGTEVSIEEAIQDFLEHFAEAWGKEKLRRDNLDQRDEIEKHKYYRSKEAGRDIGKAVAAQEWCEQYAAIWRKERECLERNGFARICVVVRNEHGLHMRPISEVAILATKYDCDLYVHRDGMPYWNFLLEGRPYLNVKSVVSFLSLGVVLGEQLEFIATGAQDHAALADLTRLLTLT